MIREIIGTDLDHNNVVLGQMFNARRRLFKERLDWDVSVDERGWERDEYDHADALYLISVDEKGTHQGSLRLLPTTGETMLRDHFKSVFDGIEIKSPVIWECTRFCVDSTGETALTLSGVQRVTTELLLGICEYSLASNIRKIVGVFDRRMIRIYSRGGWKPEVVGQSGEGRDAVYLGIWDVTKANAAAIRSAGGFSHSVLERNDKPRPQSDCAAVA